MPEFTGATDEKHTFTLPSEIDSVHWDRRQAAPGGKVGLDIRTLFCGDGSQIQIKLKDAQGTVHTTLSGKLRDNRVNIDLRVPKQAKGGLVAQVKLPNHGLSAESWALKILDPVRVRSPKWSTETVSRGDVVTLTAEARGAPDGRQARVRIFERNPGRGAHDPVTHLQPRTEGGAVEVMYQFRYPGDTADILPEWEAPNGYTQPGFFYTVEVAGVTADSKTSKSKGVMTFVDDLTVQVVDAKSGAPYANQKTQITLADGSTKEKTTSGSGKVELNEIPPGPAKIRLPELKAPDEDAEAGNPPDRTHLVLIDPDRPAEPAVVPTGPPCRLRVARQPRLASL
jgi:hypothetical protein